MKVRATAWGYYGNIGRNPGEVFVLKPFTDRRSGKPILITAEEQFSTAWMEKVEESAKVKRGNKPSKRSDLYPPKQAANARDANEPREEMPDDFAIDEDPRNENPSEIVI